MATRFLCARVGNDRASHQLFNLSTFINRMPIHRHFGRIASIHISGKYRPDISFPCRHNSIGRPFISPSIAYSFKNLSFHHFSTDSKKGDVIEPSSKIEKEPSIDEQNEPLSRDPPSSKTNSLNSVESEDEKLPQSVVVTTNLSDDDIEFQQSRIQSLSTYAKTLEMRRVDTLLKRLNTIRDIHTGEHNTWKGQFKALARDYGMGFMIYWTGVWMATGAGCYFALEMGGVDAMDLLAKLDATTGTDLSSKIDPTLGNVAVAIAVNELIEPIRLPFVVLTVKPVVNFIRKGKI